MLNLEKLLDGVEGKEELIKNINSELGKEFVPRSEFNTKNEELKNANATLKERDEQLESLSKVAGNKDALTAEIEKLKQENEAAATKYQNELQEMKLNAAIEREIAGIAKEDARDIIPNLINKEELVLKEDGTVVGLKEIVEGLKETRKSLFKTEEEGTAQVQFVKGGTKTTNVAMTKEQIKAIVDPVERRMKIAENIELFK